MLYSLKVFAGSVLRIEAKLINESQSVNAVNTKLDSGALKPWAAPLFRSTPTKVGEKKSIFRWAPVAGDNNSGFWFHWIDINYLRLIPAQEMRSGLLQLSTSQAYPGEVYRLKSQFEGGRIGS